MDGKGKPAGEPGADRAAAYRGVKIALLVLGAVTLASGATAVFVTANDGGAAALVIAGAALLGLGVLLERISSFKAGPVELQLLELARIQVETAAAVETGDRERAADLSDRARALVASVSPLAAEYEQIRAARPSGRERARELNRIVEAARRRASAEQQSVTRESLELLFETGGEGNRLSALALMQERPLAASLPVLESAILHPTSDFELFHALLAAEAVLEASALDAARRSQLLASVEEALESGKVGSEPSDRLRVARRIVAMH